MESKHENIGTNENQNIIPNSPQQESPKILIPLIDEPSPDYLLVADKPLNKGGIPQKLSRAEIQEKFNFNYNENILISADINEKITTTEQYQNERTLAKLRQRLQQPLNDKLVVCYKNEKVGYTVITTDFIEAGTVIGLYAGEIEEQKGRSDYGMSIGGTSFRVNAQEHGGITRFIPHAPFDINAIAREIHHADIDKYIKILDGNAIYFDVEQVIQLVDPDILGFSKKSNIEKINRDTKKLQEELDVNEILKNINNLATANVMPYVVTINSKPILYIKACRNIQKNEELFISYGFNYWLKKGIMPQYFYKNGNIIPKDLYIPTLQKILWRYTPEGAPSISLNGALHRAVILGKMYDVILFLLEYGASIDDQIEDVYSLRRTPLQTAIIHYGYAKVNEADNVDKMEKMVELLMHAGANLDLQDSTKSTALHYAVKNDLQDIAELLLGQGVAFLRDEHERLAFDYNYLLAQKIFGERFDQNRSIILSKRGYEYKKVAEGETGYWLETESEFAGLYADYVTVSKLIIFFGEKKGTDAITMMNFNGTPDISAIKNEQNSFDKVPEILVIYRSKFSKETFNNLKKQLNANGIGYREYDIKDKDIVILHYTLQNMTKTPRIEPYSDKELKDFYGVLVGHSSPPGISENLTSHSLVGNVGVEAILVQLNNLTMSICTKKWSKYKTDSVSLKTGDENLAKDITKYLLDNGIKSKVLGGDRIVIENTGKISLTNVKPMSKPAVNENNEGSGATAPGSKGSK